MTLAICPWLQVTWLTTTTTTTWSNIIRQVMLLLIMWPSARDLPSNVANISNVTLLCKSRAHGRCQCQKDSFVILSLSQLISPNIWEWLWDFDTVRTYLGWRGQKILNFATFPNSEVICIIKFDLYRVIQGRV